MAEFVAVKKDLADFVRWAYDSFGATIKPYLRHFIAEKKGLSTDDLTKPAKDTRFTAPESTVGRACVASALGRPGPNAIVRRVPQPLGSIREMLETTKLNRFLVVRD